jgi:hypothetical protein
MDKKFRYFKLILAIKSIEKAQRLRNKDDALSKPLLTLGPPALFFRYYGELALEASYSFCRGLKPNDW